MKAIFLILALFLLRNTIFCQHSNHFNLIQNENEIIIDFSILDYEIIDTANAFFPYGETYSYINISDDFGIINDIGYPELPQISIDIAVPSDIDEIHIQISDTNFIFQNLINLVLPHQDYLEDEFLVFEKDESYYNSDGSLYNFNYKISDTFNVFGQKGVTLSIFPIIYNPSANSLKILQSGRFSLTYTSNQNVKNNNISNNYPTEKYISDVFINYPNELNKAIIHGNYLIITPQQFENTIQYFANYKRNIGYNVEVVNTTATGQGANQIRNFIQARYNNTATRPTFILLVGDVNNIPASAGIQGDEDDPLTDLDYVRLNGDDYFADAFIGRWSVDEDFELQNIIQKTIVTETQVHTFVERATFLSGGGDGENQFKTSLRYIVNNTFNPEGWVCATHYAVDGATQADGRNELNNDNIFFIYRGHGNALQIRNPYLIDGEIVDTSTGNTFPFFFSFACHTNNFGFVQGGNETDCIGENWIRSNQGGVSFFGASTVTRRNHNNIITKRVFGDAFVEREQLCTLKDLGMKRYWNRMWSNVNRNRVKRHMKSYNLMGDPSIILKGLGCLENLTFENSEVFSSNDIIQYSVNNTIENNNSFTVLSGSNVSLIAGSEIIINSEFIAQEGCTFIAINAPCEGNNISKKLTTSGDDTETIDIEEEIKTELITNNSLLNVELFPNPFKNYLLLNYSIEKRNNITITIYNISGNIVYRKNIHDFYGTQYENINTTNLPAGLYVLTVQTSDSKFSSKIIKSE